MIRGSSTLPPVNPPSTPHQLLHDMAESHHSEDNDLCSCGQPFNDTLHKAKHWTDLLTSAGYQLDPEGYFARAAGLRAVNIADQSENVDAPSPFDERPDKMSSLIDKEIERASKAWAAFDTDDQRRAALSMVADWERSWPRLVDTVKSLYA